MPTGWKKDPSQTHLPHSDFPFQFSCAWLFHIQCTVKSPACAQGFFKLMLESQFRVSGQLFGRWAHIEVLVLGFNTFTMVGAVMSFSHVSYHMTICAHQVSSLVFASTAVRKAIPREQVTSGMEKNIFYGKESGRKGEIPSMSPRICI